MMKFGWVNRHENWSLKKLLVVLLVIFGGGFFYGQNGETTTVTITNARQTDYKKDPVSGNDTIVLTGNVEISVAKGAVSTEIKAEKITYDRKTEMLFAEGNVSILTKSSSAGGENTTASALLMNTATLEGIFDDGRVVQTKSDALNLPSGSTLVVFSDVFGKTESNTIAFKNSSLTFCDDDNPHWKINASRTWLLPGGEFAFFNALLYVGPVPVLYLPAFYYPKDELIYNPAFGYSPRKGYYINTTTYIIGRKNVSDSSSSSGSSDSVKALYNFMKSNSMKEQERQGLMLHNLDDDYKGSTNNLLKIEADIYSNLGAMIGAEGNFAPSEKYLTALNFDAKLGFTNTVFNQSGNYLPLSAAGEKFYDYSNFLGLKLPFRYGGNLNLTFNKPIKMTLSLPVYSDPSFSSDFNTRQESIDWISFLMGGNDSDTTVSDVTSLTWKLSGSYSPVLPKTITPYISSVSLSFNSSVNISATNTDLSEDERTKKDSNWKNYTPEKKFYYPSQVTPASINMSMNGTIFQWPKANKSTSSSSKTVSFPGGLEKPEELKKPSEIAAEEEKKRKEKEKDDAGNGNTEKELTVAVETAESSLEENEAVEFILPEIPQLTATIPSLKTTSGLSYKLGYSITPNLVTQVAYSTTDKDSNIYLKTPEDFKWSKIKSFMYTVKAPVALTSNLAYGGNIVSLSNKFSYDSLWQGHPNTDGYNETQRNSLMLSDYNAENQSISNTNSFSLKPFAFSSVFSGTGISWNSTMKLYKRKFSGTVEEPSWEDKFLDLDDSDTFTSHSLSFIFDAREGNSKYNQNFTYTTSLPPQVTKHNFALNLKFPYVTAGLSTGFNETSLTDKTIVYSPLQQTLSLFLFNSSVKISENFSYAYNLSNLNFQDKSAYHPESLRLSVNWKTLTAAYVMSYTTGYELVSGAGWMVNDEKEFLPYSFSLSYSTPSKTFLAWKNRISLVPGLSTSIVADLIRPTNTYFSITPNLTFKINEFFNISFSSTSRNSILYWYFNDGLYDEGLFGWDFFPFNMLADLINSYRFDKQSLREGSGFKLKTLAMNVSHELDDWSFNMTWKFEPRVVTKNNKKVYDFSPYISIGVIWTPMPSIKTTIVDDYGTWKLNGDK